MGIKPNGHRKIITVTAANKTACIKEMKRKDAEWNKNRITEMVSPSTTVGELCRQHLQYQIKQEELKPKSIDRRECTIENHINAYPLGHMQIQSVKVADIDDHISRLIQEGKLSVSSIEKVLDVLNAAFNWAMIRGEIDFNPVAPIKPTLVKRIQKLQQKKANDADVVVLSIEEERLFEQEAMRTNPKTGKYVYPAGLYGILLLHTGIRCGEMLALRWRDVDLERGYLTIEKSCSMAKNRGKGEAKFIAVEGTTKNSKARKIKLTPKAEETLKQLWTISKTHDADDLVVITQTGRQNTATNLEHRMAVIFRNAGLTEMTGALHIFRRTFATRLYERGVRVKEIAAYIGDLESTTEKYYISVRKKVKDGERIDQIVILPTGATEN